MLKLALKNAKNRKVYQKNLYKQYVYQKNLYKQCPCLNPQLLTKNINQYNTNKNIFQLVKIGLLAALLNYMS